MAEIHRGSGSNRLIKRGPQRFKAAVRSSTNQPVNYVLSCSAGAYTVTGVAATTKAARQLVSSVGTYAVTGVLATPQQQRKVAANSGSYNITGVNNTQTAQRKLSASAGAYNITGQSAAIGKQSSLIANAGSYSLTGVSATLSATILPKAYSLLGNAGAYVMAGNDADLALPSAERTGAPPYKPPKRHVINHNGELIAFRSKDDAIAFLNAQGDAKILVAKEVKPQAIKSAKEAPINAEISISLDEIRLMAERHQALTQFQNQLRRQQFEALIKAYEMWVDEDEIELLLMVA